jgi:thiol-disulfide isomerase/thioredoxin
MATTRERFASGMTYQQYKDQMTRNKERFEANERDLKLSTDEVAPFKALSRPVNVLVLAEDWCGDVIANLPILGRIAAETGNLNVRIFLRDHNSDIMDQYLNKGQFKSIPVFVTFDDGFNEIGRFVERPESVTRLRAEKRAELFAAHPEFGSPTAPVDQLPEDVRLRLTQAMSAIREETAMFANAAVVRELADIVSRPRA